MFFHEIKKKMKANENVFQTVISILRDRLTIFRRNPDIVNFKMT